MILRNVTILGSPRQRQYVLTSFQMRSAPKNRLCRKKQPKHLAITNKSLNFAASYGQITPATDLKQWVYTLIEVMENSVTLSLTNMLTRRLSYQLSTQRSIQSSAIAASPAADVLESQWQ